MKKSVGGEAYGPHFFERIMRRIIGQKVQRSTFNESVFFEDFTFNEVVTGQLFCYQFAACCALLNGRRSVLDVQTTSILNDPLLTELTEASTLDTYERPDGAKYIKMVVEMSDGGTFESEKSFDGSKHTRPSREELLAKFWDQFDAFGNLPRSYGEEIIRMTSLLENIPDMREYTELLRPKA